ncbi:hypothetical protein P872_00260 [Rhodonellum psychrophilum GCM71 = DSM 17998]|uniref:Lipoprotein n=2 Tax=Rhodonellum TaxID=336827 RepID=U5C5Q8_9BACT|nr:MULTISPECIES: hypothetical protein [Rhodonellum]ERM83542.1 hypothetical protein P872_00260 [Rhodonellum psychrophilum GCM71 = DSM 17998]SDY52486.1 hypothetical protein SAMN05444412_101421 [Rhodonellum ikkaensis]
MKKTVYVFMILGLGFLGACGSEKTTEVKEVKEVTVEKDSKTEIKFNTKDKDVKVKTKKIDVEINGN